MGTLFRHRLSRHLIQMTHYLKYVFNDFFVIALIFLVGGLGLEYANFLKHLHHGSPLLSLVIVLILLVMMQFGRLATLVKPADYVFLLPRSRSLKSYLKRAYVYSVFNAFIIQIVTWFVLLPVLKIDLDASKLALCGYLVLLGLIKVAWLASDLDSANWRSFRGAKWFFRWLLPAALLLLAVFFNLPIALLIAIIWGISLLYVASLSDQVNWRWLISAESHRMHTLYRLFNLFLDVPQAQSSVKHRRYLAPVLKLVRPNHKNTYLYLYLRGILRDTEFSGLYFRLTVIGFILLLFVQGDWLPPLISLLFVYLIAFQLIPFYSHFDGNAFVHLYPVSLTNRVKGFRKVIGALLLITVILFVVALIGSSNLLGIDAVSIVLMVLEILYLLKFYLPKSIRKLESRDS